MRQTAVVLWALLVVIQPTRAATLDDLDPRSCDELKTQLASNSDAIVLFNSTSHASINAFHAGRHDDGCRSFVSVLHYVGRLISKLDECIDRATMAGRDADEDRRLLVGFQDLKQHLAGIDRREGCSPQS